MDAVLTKFIETTPGTCGGKPRVAGTRIRVQDIVLWTEMGSSPDEIVSDYPHLSLAAVHAALSYYHDHRSEIDRDIQQADELVDAMLSSPSSRLGAAPPTRDADADSVSS